MFRNICILSLFVFLAHQAEGTISPTEFIEGGIGAMKHGVEAAKNCLASVGVAANDLKSFDGLINIGSCSIYCAGHGVGIFNAAGTLNDEFFKNINFGPFQTEVNTLVQHCHNKDSGSKCKSAKDAFLCALHEGIFKNVVKQLATFIGPLIAQAIG